MTTLSDFTQEEQELLIKLPYCVGMFISRADNEQSQEETQREMVALIRILQVLPNLYENTPLVQEILTETHNQNEKWDTWLNSDFVIQEEGPKAMAYLRQKATSEELHAYAKAAHEIADTVARAVSEAGSFEIQQVPRDGIMKLIYNAMKAIGMTSAQNSKNITATEMAAIAEVDAALKFSE